MEFALFSFVLLVIVLFVVKILLPQLLSGDKGYPYTKDLLFSPAERSFFGVLEAVVGDKYKILAKVRLADIIKVKSGVGKQDWGRAFSRIQSKHVDFVLCDPKDLSVQLMVELDDSSHDAKDRKARDIFVDKALETAGIKVVRVKARKSYKLEEVRKALFPNQKEPKEKIKEEEIKEEAKVKVTPRAKTTLEVPEPSSKLDKYWGSLDSAIPVKDKDAPYQVAEGGRRTGGYYSLVEVQSAYQKGELAKDALYWKNGMKEWLPVSSL